MCAERYHMNYIGGCSGLKYLRENFVRASVLNGHDFSRADKTRERAWALAAEARSPSISKTPALIGRVRLRRIILRQNRSAVLEPRRRVHHLAGLRFGKPKLASHSVDAAGAAELRFAEPELPVLFAKLIQHLLL